MKWAAHYADLVSIDQQVHQEHSAPMCIGRCGCRQADRPFDSGLGGHRVFLMGLNRFDG
jgi:hypothetical protein